MPLNPHVHDFLLMLERAQAAGQEWVSVADVQAIPADQRDIAVGAGWVKQRGFGNVRTYKILPSGYTALADNAEAVAQQLRTGQMDRAARIRSLIQPVGDPVVLQIAEPEEIAAVYTEIFADDAADVDPIDALVGIFGDDAHQPDSVASEPTLPAESTAEICTRKNCGEPRRDGSTLCEKHYQQKRAANTAYRAKQYAAKTQPSLAVVLAADEPPVDDDATQPDILPVQPQGVRLTRLLVHTAVRSYTIARRFMGIR